MNFQSIFFLRTFFKCNLVFRFTITLFCLFSFGSMDGQTYGSSIANGQFASCTNSPITCSGITYNENIITIGVHADPITSNVIRLVVAKCDGSDFQNNATFAILEDDLCNPSGSSTLYNINSGSNGTNSVYYTANFSSGSKDLYILLQSGGSLFYAGPLTIYAPPPEPNLINATTYPDNSIQLLWNNVSNEDGYNVFRADCSNCNYQYQGTVPANSTTYQDANLTCGIDYCYKVTAFSNDGATGTSSDFSNHRCASEIIPTGLTPGATNSSASEQLTTIEPYLDWDDFNGGSTYAIVVKDLSSNEVVIAKTTNVSSYQVALGELQSGKSYVWKVAAICGSGNVNSNSIYFTTPPSTPPYLQFGTCMSVTPSIMQPNTSVTITTSVENSGGSIWGGAIRAVIRAVGANTDSLEVYNNSNVTITSQDEHTILISPIVILAPFDYEVFVLYKTLGNNNWEYVNRANCSPYINNTHYEELKIQNTTPATLKFSECITAPDEIEQGQTISGNIKITNYGTDNWNGLLNIFAQKRSTSITKSLFFDPTYTIVAGNTITINFSDDGAINDTLMGQIGNYDIYVSYTNAPNGYGSSALDYVEQGDCNSSPYTLQETGTISHDHKLVLVAPGQGSNVCNITNPDPSLLEAHTAATFLCEQGIIDEPTNGDADPYANITRGQLAKILYFGLLGPNPSPTVASQFPTPFLDLIDPNTFYYDAAKALSYLDYGDMKAPFDNEFANFNPYNGIKRGHLLKALLEAFNVSPLPGTIPVAGVSPSHEMYEYVNRACDINIIFCNNDFRPDDLAQRYEAFILLWRFMEINPNLIPTVQSDDFFIPLNVKPENMGKGMGFADANFKHYTRTSFSIPGKKIPLVFEHVYNSYSVDLPNQLYEDYGRPMGEGWSHSYHCYIQKFDHYIPDSSKLVVFWPGNSLNVYYQNGLEAITKNLYDIVTDNGNTISIKKKNQIVYTFTRLSNGSDVWLLESIKDRNNNTIALLYENYSGAKKRLKKVIGTAGRALNFFYNIAGEPSYISQVSDPQRDVYFTYNNDDLITYKDPGGKITTYNYGETDEDEHLILSIQLPKGNIITNTYDQRKLNSTSTNNQTVTGAWQWTSSGVSNTVNMPVTNGSLDLNYTQNTQGNTTSLQVGQPGNNLHTMNIQYNDPDNPYLPTYVDVNGDVINYTYDNNGNVEQINLPLGVTHQFAYTSLNDVDYYIDPRGNTTDFAYDGVGNLKIITDPLGNATLMDYFSNGLIKKVTNPENIAVNYTYDNYGNLEAINAPEGIQVAMTYDVLGRMETYTDPNGQVTTTYYHPDDLVDKVKNAMNEVSDYTYDNNNNLTGIENVNGETTILEYDHEHDWLKKQSFGNQSDEFEYYPDGRLFTHTDSKGQVDIYTYDAQGRLMNDGYATYEYYPSPDNQLKKVTNVNGAVEFTYDALNRVKTVKDFYNNIITYDYDMNSNLEKITYPDGKMVTYIYDAANRLEEVIDWNNKSTTYAYLNDNRLKRTDYPNGTYTIYSYDNAGRMTGLANYKSSTEIINSYSYVLDPSGNHLQVSQTEPYGNFNWTSGQTVATYDEQNHIQTFGGLNYSDDNNGNITSINGTADYDFHWDSEDQLASIDIGGSQWASYTYDALGHRRKAVRNGVTTKYVLDILGMSKVLMETDNSNNPIYYYIHGLGQIARIDASGNYHYYHYDYRGSTIAMTDDNKNITHQYQYGPYGEVLQENEIDFNAYKYVGAFGVQYENSDVYFMRARYYDVLGKRFISEDPVWGENLYKYADGNPIRFVDVDGNLATSLEILWLKIQLGTSSAASTVQNSPVGIFVVKAIEQSPEILMGGYDGFQGLRYMVSGNREKRIEHMNKMEEHFDNFAFGYFGTEASAMEEVIFKPIAIFLDDGGGLEQGAKKVATFLNPEGGLDKAAQKVADFLNPGGGLDKAAQATASLLIRLDKKYEQTVYNTLDLLQSVFIPTVLSH